MARKARPNSRTTVRYVCPEDTAIGLAPDEPDTTGPNGEVVKGNKEFSEGWRLYNETFDESHLRLKDGETPSYYYLKPLTLDAQTKFFEAFADDADEATSMFQKAFSPAMKHILRDFVDRFVVGADYHEEVVRVDECGNFETRSCSWTPGDIRPDWFVDSIMADSALCFNLFMFAVNSSKLSEKEKKP